MGNILTENSQNVYMVAATISPEGGIITCPTGGIASVQYSNSLYNITFSYAFTSAPTTSATLVTPNAQDSITVQNVTTTSLTIQCTDHNGNKVQRKFGFIAVEQSTKVP